MLKAVNCYESIMKAVAHPFQKRMGGVVDPHIDRVSRRFRVLHTIYLPP